MECVQPRLKNSSDEEREASKIKQPTYEVRLREVARNKIALSPSRLAPSTTNFVPEWENASLQATCVQRLISERVSAQTIVMYSFVHAERLLTFSFHYGPRVKCLLLTYLAYSRAYSHNFGK